jgi:hypothetical protein
MGYELHITRAKSWAQNTKHRISVEEWLAYVAKDPELSLSRENGPYFVKWSGKSKLNETWLDWHDGNIETKSPDEALIDKMVAIARELGATVQGDDGEIYQSGHEPPRHPQPSVFDRLSSWLRALRPARPPREIHPDFGVGDRVSDAFHRVATVIEIDPKSTHGLGKVKIRYDDGREMSFMLAASGLSPVRQGEKES